MAVATAVIAGVLDDVGQTAAVEELWAEPRPEVADALRGVAERLVTEASRLSEEIAGSSLAGFASEAISSDPLLAVEDHRANRSDLLQWLTSNIHRPGRRVEPRIGPEVIALARDLRTRGITADFVGAWRSALGSAWRRWLEECLTHVEDRALLVDLLDVSAQSMTQFALDSIAALRAAEPEILGVGADLQALTTIRLLLDGVPVDLGKAQAQLGYRLGDEHTAVVLWAEEEGRGLDAAAAALARTWPSGVLVAAPGATVRWLWMPTARGGDSLEEEQVRAVVQACDGVRACLGRPAAGVEGFASSHEQALVTQAVLIRSESPRRVGSHAEWDLVDAITRDRRAATAFVRRTLGALADADATVRDALLTYIQTGFSATRTAEAVYAHRNTVERRVARATALCPTAIDANPAQVAAALLVRRLADPD